MELLDLIIIIPIRKVFLPQILLELFPLQFSFDDPLYLIEVFPPNGWFSIQIEYGNSYLHVSWIIMHLKALHYPKKPSFSLLSSLYLTIKCRRFGFLKFIPRAIPIVSFSFPFTRIWTCIPAGFFRVRWSTRIPSPSPNAALTTFQSCYTSSRVYLSLQVCQNLQHWSIQLMLLFLRFNQDSHGSCNIW